ncbi:hypothetical protein ABZ883_34435 [Streptomyces sp. NPDC046977]|uniref:hypothetical protein n=1 Tax=Streptomyces sp. NPDC046977 TaxID=3154703 RepID=UPI0033E54C67
MIVAEFSGLFGAFMYVLNRREPRTGTHEQCVAARSSDLPMRADGLVRRGRALVRQVASAALVGAAQTVR